MIHNEDNRATSTLSVQHLQALETDNAQQNMATGKMERLQPVNKHSFAYN